MRAHNSPIIRAYARQLLASATTARPATDQAPRGHGTWPAPAPVGPATILVSGIENARTPRGLPRFALSPAQAATVGIQLQARHKC